VSIRRGGVFRNIATTRDLNKALRIGRTRTGRTLAASFKVTGANLKLPNLPGYRKVKRKTGTIFIEHRGRRIKKVRTSGGGEVKELFRAKAFKKKKKKKGGKKNE